MPLYKLLKKSDQFWWADKAQEAFDRLKSFLAAPLTLVSLTRTSHRCCTLLPPLK